jgi:hypothetical protein
MWKKLRRLLSICLLGISIVLILWSFLPAQRLVEVHPVQPGLKGVKPIGYKQPSLPGERQVRLEWPSSMRIGDQSEILLEFEYMEEGSSASELEAGFYDVYDSFNIMAETKLEAAGVNIEPANPTRVSMLPGQSVHLKWLINPEQAGIYHGKVWLSLRFLPLDGSTPVQVPVYINEVELKVTSLIGLSASMARLVGAAGLLLSLLLVFNDMINWSKDRTAMKATMDKKVT